MAGLHAGRVAPINPDGKAKTLNMSTEALTETVETFNMRIAGGLQDLDSCPCTDFPEIGANPAMQELAEDLVGSLVMMASDAGIDRDILMRRPTLEALKHTLILAAAFGHAIGSRSTADALMGETFDLESVDWDALQLTVDRLEEHGEPASDDDDDGENIVRGSD